MLELSEGRLQLHLQKRLCLPLLMGCSKEGLLEVIDLVHHYTQGSLILNQLLPVKAVQLRVNKVHLSLILDHLLSILL